MAKTTDIKVPKITKAGKGSGDPDDDKDPNQINELVEALKNLTKAVDTSTKETKDQTKELKEAINKAQAKKASASNTSTSTSKTSSARGIEKYDEELKKIQLEKAKISLNLAQMSQKKQQQEEKEREALRIVHERNIKKQIAESDKKDTISGKVEGIAEKGIDSIGDFGGSLIAGSLLGINPTALRAMNKVMPIGKMAKWGMKKGVSALGKGWRSLMGSTADTSKLDTGDTKPGTIDNTSTNKPNNPAASTLKEKAKGKKKLNSDADGNGKLDPKERSNSAIAGGEKREVLKKMDTIINTLKGKKDKAGTTEEKKDEPGWLSKIWDFAKGAGGKILMAFAGLKLLPKLLGKALWSGVKQLPGLIWKGLKGLWKLGGHLLKSLKPLGKFLLDSLKPLGEFLLNALKGIWDWIKGGAKKAVDAAKGVAKKGVEKAGQVLSKAKDVASKGVSKAGNFIKGVGKSVTNSKAGQLVSKVGSKALKATKGLGGLAKGGLKIAGKAVAPITSLVETGLVFKDIATKGAAQTYEDTVNNWSGWDWINPSKLATVGGGWIGDKIGNFLSTGSFKDQTGDELMERARKELAKNRAKRNGTTVEEEERKLLAMAGGQNKGTVQTPESQLSTMGTSVEEQARLSTNDMPTTQEMANTQQSSMQQEQLKQNQVIKEVIIEKGNQAPVINNNYATTVQQERTCYPVGDVARTVLFGATTY